YCLFCVVFSFHGAATPHTSTLSLHDALPISAQRAALPLAEQVPRPVDHGEQGLVAGVGAPVAAAQQGEPVVEPAGDLRRRHHPRSEEHTSELQSRENLVCRLLLEKKKKKHN